MSFYKMLSNYYDELFPSNQTQIAFIQSIIKDKHRILDVAAGTGNQSLELVKKGYEVTAIDLDPEMVGKIRKKSTTMQLAVDAFELDMRDINQLASNSFDAVICIGNSIVHLDTLEQIETCLTNIHSVLTDHGAIVVQIVNYERILKQQISELPVIKRPEHNLEFHRTYELYNGKIKFNGKLIVEQSNQQEIFTNSVELIPLTSAHMKNALEVTGFCDIQLFGNFSGEPFQSDSPALIAVAYK